jgi:hypothetical protein
MPSEVAQLIEACRGPGFRLEELYGEVFSDLETELKRAGYRGPVGIDAFVYRTAGGTCRLKPVVEINPRYTMGRVTLELMRQLCPGSHALFRLVNRVEARKACTNAKSAGASASTHDGSSPFPQYASLLGARLPVRMEGQPVPRIREGAVVLNDPCRSEACLAVLQVSRGGQE